MSELRDIAKNKGLFVVPKPAPPPQLKLKTYPAAGQTLIQGEFADQLESVTASYLKEYSPVGMMETILVRDLAAAQCRADYALRLQDQPGVNGNEKILATLAKYRTTNQSSYKRSLKALKAMQKKRFGEEALRPRLVKSVAVESKDA